MTAKLAARLGLLLLLTVSGYAMAERRKGGLDRDMRVGLVTNLLGVAVLWLRTDKAVEGPTLLALTHEHGVALADLLSFLPVLIALQLVRDQGLRVSALLNRR